MLNKNCLLTAMIFAFLQVACMFSPLTTRTEPCNRCQHSLSPALHSSLFKPYGNYSAGDWSILLRGGGGTKQGEGPVRHPPAPSPAFFYSVRANSFKLALN